MNKALIVGVDRYGGGNDLRGCVHKGDATAMAEAMVSLGFFKPEEIRLVTDERATTAGIKDRHRTWLLSDLHAGDRILYWESGHGTTLPLRDNDGGITMVHNCFCPVDFAWNPSSTGDEQWYADHSLTDLYFHRLFADVPKGVNVLFGSDSCHSENLERRFNGVSQTGNGEKYRKSRFYPQPADIAWRTSTARGLGIRTVPMDLPIVYVSGCAIEQTSADAFRHGNYCGAFTSVVLDRLTGGYAKMPMSELIGFVCADLRAEEYEQQPRLCGPSDQLALPWVGGSS